MKPSHFAPTDPSINWIKDDFVSIEYENGHWALTPNVIQLPNQTFRMYYMSGASQKDGVGSKGYITSAVSEDGFHWVKENQVLVATDPGEGWAVCPEVIKTNQTHYRMYYQVRLACGREVILSAASHDGLSWQREPGIRLGDSILNYGSPRLLSFPNGKLRLYAYENDPQKTHHTQIVSAISENGLDFEREPGFRIEQEGPFETYSVYAPEILKLGTGSYRMYYAAWSNLPDGSRQGRIRSAFSNDGLIWKKDEGVVIDIGGSWDQIKASEPCVIQLSDGRYRLFYEACDAKGQWRILGATSKAVSSSL